VLRLIFSCLVFFVADLALLLVLADYTSWEVALLEVLISGLLGLGVIRYASDHFGRRILARLAASESPGQAVADGAILFLAGILLLLPGIMSDAAGLLLLIPPVRRLVVAWLKWRYWPRANSVRVWFAHRYPTYDSAADEIIVDSQIEDDRAPPKD